MVVTIPWCSASSASSRGVQASTGRPTLRGETQAKLTICTTCSALKVGGRPLRGASARVAAIVARSWAGSVSAAAKRLSASSQRSRHFCTVSGEQVSWAASGSMRAPSAIASTIRTRTTSACGQECWRSNCSNTARWGGETLIARATGPAIGAAFYVIRATSLLSPASYHNSLRIFGTLY